MAVKMLAQLAVDRQWTPDNGDFKDAFLQSGEFPPDSAPLYMEIPQCLRGRTVDGFNFSATSVLRLKK